MEDTCFYCGTAPASPSSSYLCPMYRENASRLFTRIDKTVVTVPRCCACCSVHRRYTCLSYGVSSMVVVLIAVSVIYMQRQMSFWDLISLTGGVAILAVVGGEIINRWWFERIAIPRRHSIKSQGDVHEANVVREMQFKGWGLRDSTPS